MKVVIFGASGMVGQGALQECLRDPDVQLVVSVVRAASSSIGAEPGSRPRATASLAE